MLESVEWTMIKLFFGINPETNYKKMTDMKYFERR